VENVGYTSSSSLKFKANFGLTWDHGPWNLGWTGRYFDSYLVINPAVASTQNGPALITQGNGGRVSSQIYHDVFAAYRLRGDAMPFGSQFLSGAEVRLGIQNVFNTEPPVDTRTSIGYSSFADPRLASYFLSLKATF
jgi:outer membrane receptor protein involved in Fe transport